MKRSFIIALHLGYWILYLLLILLFIVIINAGISRPLILANLYLSGFIKYIVILTILPAILSFYAFYYFLFNKYLSRKKILRLCIAGFATIILSASLATCILYILLNARVKINAGKNVLPEMSLFMAILSFIHGTIALVMKGFVKWYDDIRLKQALLQKNFETELALVKAQLDPHFLFNTINNIDVLIEKDAIKASAYLNKLSDILRFMLYETKTENITLQKELSYIGKYIGLQKIRHGNADYVQYSVKGDPGRWIIAPMLFIPFIENAFKHAAAKKNGRCIMIKVTVCENRLDFYCENIISESRAFKKEEGSLGKTLIKKRLDLLYPGRYKLSASCGEGLYKVELSISPK